MAGRIRDEDVVAVRERANIADVIGESVQLRNAGGGRLKGLCPFHDEKTPSFNVNPALNMYHCLAGETEVITQDGVVPIRELAGRTARVLTVGSGGAATWVDAPFRSFGVQPLLKLTVTRNGRSKEIFATAEHRWFVEAGGRRQGRAERVTRALRPGDRLASAFPRNRVHLPMSRPSPFGIARGFTYGDATSTEQGSVAMLVGDKSVVVRRSPFPGFAAPERRGWVVKSVEETDRVEEVYCAQVEGTHNFALAGNILTGNCFGCGESGDVISFVRNTEHLSFVEAIERLAGRYGVTLQYEQGGSATGRQTGQRTRLVEAHRVAKEWFIEQLAGDEAVIARTFLAERGFDQAAAEQFGVGYALNGWDHLVKHLRGKGFRDDELVLSGLASEGQRGPIDRFRGRLVWPIADITGDVIGFGARRLHESDNGPKYLNSPETPIYKKSTVLYGVEAAKKEIARRRQAVVVEGYTDVMAMHLAGVPTAVATCGTAFGPEHISVLRRLLMDQDEFRGEVIFTFDGDEAGQKAALKAFGDEQRFVAQTFVAISPDGMDPCDLRLAKGDVAVRDVVAARVPLVEFAIRSTLSKYDLDTAEGRVQAMQATAPLVARIKDRALRPEYARRLAGWLGMEVEPVAARVSELAGDRATTRRRPAAPVSADAAALQVEREAVKLAVQLPVITGPVYDSLDASVFTDESLRAVHEVIGKAGGVATSAGGEEWVTRLLEHCPDDDVRQQVRVLAVESLRSDAEPDQRYAGAVLARVQEHAATRRVAELKPRLQRVNPVEEPELYGRLFAELIAMEQTVRSHRERGIGSL